MNASPATFLELDDSAYTRRRLDLLRTRGSDRQREFLSQVRDSADFVEAFADVRRRGSTSAALAPYPMTESEYKDPPGDTEQDLHASWSALTPAVACRSAFWAMVTLDHIRKGRIQSVYLAANGGSLPGGAERIDAVLQDKTLEAPRRIDSCVRTVLRRLGGLPEVRGNRSVYVDCPFARAWWRERIVAQAAGGDDRSARQVRRVVRIHQTYWEKLVDRIVFRNSTFGSTNIRNALLRTLAQFLSANPDSDLSTYQSFQRLCRRTTAYQGRLEMSILSDSELDELMVAVVKNAADSTG
ncbi:MAG: hypothetical protein OXH52_12955 [Gammaproteobacteria bacterium]|nr:hypothetical protein [Gammaproteobacteria bacterium]